MKLRIDACVLCHVGNVRGNNEDNYYLQHRIRADVGQKVACARFAGAPRLFLAAVADGMGGAQRGDVASLLAVRALHPAAPGRMRKAARRSVSRANEEICAQMRQLGGRMGSTLAALYMADDRVLCANVGDSRAYLLRAGHLMRLTKDHSKAQQLMDLGILTPEQAQRHPSRHELTRHLGIFPEEMALEPDMGPELEMQSGDCFLLCSDGLYDGMTDGQIEKVLAGGGSPQQRAQALVDQALAGGSRDNVTAMVIQIRDRMGIREWIRATISNMSRSSTCGRSRSC